MCQTLFHIPSVIFGIPVFGFGLAFFLFVFIVFVAVCLRVIKTGKFEVELLSYLAMVFVIGVVLVYIVPDVLESQGFPVRGYGVCLLFAFLSAIGLSAWLGSSRGIPVDAVVSLGFWVTICGILGTRVFYVTEYWDRMEVSVDGKLQLLPTLFNIVNISNGGLVVIGGIIGGTIGATIFAWRNKYNALVILDLIVPTVMLGIAIGRIGCFLNGCCFGGVCDLPWAVTFPVGSPAHICQIERGDTYFGGIKFKQSEHKKDQLIINEIDPNLKPKLNPEQAEKLKPGLVLHSISGFTEKDKIATYTPKNTIEVSRTLNYFQHCSPDRTVRFDFFDESIPQIKSSFASSPTQDVLPVHPTQIYSSISALILCFVLLSVGRFNWIKSHKGSLTAVFLILYGSVRFCIEIIRTDEESFLNTDLTISQNLSIGLIIIGLLLFIGTWIYQIRYDSKLHSDK
ncbi:MAG: prolipoprotein diacylglyceryl transferase [Planctomycetaceae bacterium]|jgi:phosphatidylglycerol:prolipoprotein diacylglycerol transferase|nr:prolipoprotein diacylglyceryl transferase [Planctomycetaceae bacterium]